VSAHLWLGAAAGARGVRPWPEGAPPRAPSHSGLLEPRGANTVLNENRPKARSILQSMESNSRYRDMVASHVGLPADRHVCIPFLEQ
jgi:hypothetical protein